MSKPRRKIRGHTNHCGNKRAFETFDAAHAAAKRGRWEYMEAYQCRKCKKFHYGHPKP